MLCWSLHLSYDLTRRKKKLTVARELTKDGDHEHLGEAPAAGMSEEERSVVEVALVNAVLSDVLLHLVKLEAHKSGVGVAVAVVLDEEVGGLLLSAVCNKPAGRLRDEEDACHYEDARVGLKNQGDPPREIRLDPLASISHGSGRDGTTEPAAVVEAGAAATPVRRRDLDTVSRSGDSHDGDTESVPLSVERPLAWHV